MKRIYLAEVAVLAIMSLVSLAEGVRLTVYRDPYTLFDPLGPGRYILVLALGLSAVAVAQLIQGLRGRASGDAIAHGVGLKQVFRMVVVLAAYIALIQFLGYVAATVLFFVSAFYVVGVAPAASAVLAAIFTVSYYLIFVHYANIIFPHGLLF